MSDSKLTKISNEFDMIKIMQDIGTKFFGSDMSSERIGMLGHVTESMAHMFGAAILDSNLRSKEFFTKTAKKMDTLLNEAFIYGIEGEYATPSTMRVYIGIYIENLIGKINEGGYGIRRKIDPNDSSKDQYYFVLEKDTVITISDFSFMFENDIEIQAIPKSGLVSNYFYSVRNLTTGDKDYTSYTYDNWDENKYYTIPDSYTLSDAGGDYLQSAIVNIDGKQALIFMTNVKQISKKSEYYTVYKNDDITLTGLEFMYDDSLAYFNIYYKEDSNSEWVLLNKVSSRDTNKYSVNTMKYSIELDSKKILLSVSNFTPKFNAEFRVDIYTTKGSLGNISYEGVGDDVYVTPTSSNERHSYAGLFVSCMPLSDATGGADVMDMNKLRDKIILTKSILNGIMTDIDLNNYAKLKDELNTFLFIKKRSDIYRRYSAFTIPRMSNGDIIPSTTLTGLIRMNYDFQQHHGSIINSEEKDENNIPIYTTIKAGSAFEKVETNDNMSDEELFIKSYNEIYTDSIQIEPKFAVKLINKSSVPSDKIVEAELNGHRYALPFTLVHNNTYNLTSTYLSSISDTHIMKIGYENPNSETHFFIDHLYIYRNSISGSNTYTVKVSLFSNGDFSNAQKDNIVNSGDVENTLMLKGFIYYNSDSVETVIDFKFESYNDYLFTFTAEMEIDDSFNSAEKTNLLNGYNIKNLNYVKRYNFILRPDLYTMKDAPMTYSVNKYNHYMKSLVYDKHYRFESFNKYKGDYFAIPTLYGSEEHVIDKTLYEFNSVTNTDDDLTYVREPIIFSTISNMDHNKFEILSKIKRRRTRIGYYTDYAKYVNEPTLFLVDDDGNILGNIKESKEPYAFTRDANDVRSSVYMNPIYDTIYYYIDSSGKEVELNTPKLRLVPGTKSSGGCVSYYSNTNGKSVVYDVSGARGTETDAEDINNITHYRKSIDGSYKYFSINETATKYVMIVTKDHDICSVEYMKYDDYSSTTNSGINAIKLNPSFDSSAIYVKNGETYNEVANFDISNFAVGKYYYQIGENDYKAIYWSDIFNFDDTDSEGKYIYSNNKSDPIIYFRVNKNVFNNMDTESYYIFTKDNFKTVMGLDSEEPFWVFSKDSIIPESYDSLGRVSVDYKNPADMVQYPTYSDRYDAINDTSDRDEYRNKGRAYVRNYKELDYDAIAENGIDLNLDMYIPVTSIYTVPNKTKPTELTKTADMGYIGGMYYHNIPISYVDTSTTALNNYKALLEKGNGTNIITNVYGGNIAKLMNEYVPYKSAGTDFNATLTALQNGTTKFYVCTYFKKVDYPNERDFNDGLYYVYTNTAIYPLGIPTNVGPDKDTFDNMNEYYVESYEPVDDPTIEEYRAGLYYILYYTGIYGPALNSNIDGIGGSVGDITDEEFERIPRKYYKRTRIYTEVPTDTNETVFRRLYNDNLLYTAPGGLDVTTVYSYPMKLVDNFFSEHEDLNIVDSSNTKYAPIYYVKFSDVIDDELSQNLNTDLSNYYIPVLLNASPYSMKYDDGNNSTNVSVDASIETLKDKNIDVYIIGPMQESHEYILTDDTSAVYGKTYYVKNILSGYTKVSTWKNENKSYYYELKYDYILATSKHSASKVVMYSREVYGYDLNSLINNKYTPIITGNGIKVPITNKILVGYNNNQIVKLNNKTYTVYRYALNGYDNELENVYGSNDTITYGKIGSYMTQNRYTPFNNISIMKNQYIETTEGYYISRDTENGIYIKNNFYSDSKEYSSYVSKTFYIESTTSDGKDSLIKASNWDSHYDEIPKMYYISNNTGVINLPPKSSLYYESDGAYIVDSNIDTYSQYYTDSYGVYSTVSTLETGKNTVYYTFAKISDDVQYENLTTLFIKNSESSFTKFSAILGISTGNNYYYYNSNIEDNGHINYIAKPDNSDSLTSVNETSDGVYRNNTHLTYVFHNSDYAAGGTYEYGYPIDRIYIPMSLQSYDIRNNAFESSNEGMYIKSLRFDMPGTQNQGIDNKNNDKSYEYNAMYISKYSDYKINRYGILTPLNEYDKTSFSLNTIFAMNPNVFIKKDYSVDGENSYKLYQLEFNDNNTVYVTNFEYNNGLYNTVYSGPIYINNKNARLFNVIDENITDNAAEKDYYDKSESVLFNSNDLYLMKYSISSETGHTSVSVDNILTSLYLVSNTEYTGNIITYDEFKNGAYYIKTGYSYASAEDYNKDEVYYTVNLIDNPTDKSDYVFYKAFIKLISKFGYDYINNCISEGKITDKDILEFMNNNLGLTEQITELAVNNPTLIENLEDYPAYCVENDDEYSRLYRFDTTSMQNTSGTVDKTSYKHNLLPMIMTAKPEYSYRLSDSAWTNEISDSFYDVIVRGRYFYSYIDTVKYTKDNNASQDTFRNLYVEQKQNSDILSENIYYISTRCLNDPYDENTTYYRRNDIFNTTDDNPVGDVYTFNEKNSSFVKADYDEYSTDKYYKLIEDPYYEKNDSLYDGKKSYYPVFQTYTDGSGRFINYDYIKSGDSYIKDSYIRYAFIPYFILKNNTNIKYTADGIDDITEDNRIKKFMTVTDNGTTIELSSLNIENMRNLSLTLDGYVADGNTYTPLEATSTLYDLMKKSASFNFNMCDYGDSVYLYDQSKFGNPTLLYGANNNVIFIDTQYLKTPDETRVIKYTINKFKYEINTLNKKSLKISNISTETKYVIDEPTDTSYDDYGYNDFRKPLLPLQLINSDFCYNNEDTVVTSDTYTNNDIYFAKRVPDGVSGDITFNGSRKIDIGKLYFTNDNSPDIFMINTKIYSTVHNMPTVSDDIKTLNPIELTDKITPYTGKIMNGEDSLNIDKVFADRYYVSPKQIPVLDDVNSIAGDYAVSYSDNYYAYLVKDNMDNTYYIGKYIYVDSYVDGTQKLYRYDDANNSYILIPQENIFKYDKRYYFILKDDNAVSEESSDIYQVSPYKDNTFIEYDKTQKEYLVAVSDDGVKYYYTKLTNTSNDIYLKVHDDNGLYVIDEGFSEDDAYEQYVEKPQTLIASVKFNDKTKINLFGLDFGIGVYYLDRYRTYSVGDTEYKFDKNIGINIKYASENDIISAVLYDNKLIPGGYPIFYNNCSYKSNDGNVVELKSDYILTNVYRNVNTIDLYKDISKFVHHITTLSNDEYNDMKAFKYIPLIQYSKSLNDEYVDKLIETTTTAYGLLDDLSEKVVNNFSIDYKYFKSYGPSKYFTMIKPSDKDYGNSEDIKSPEIPLKKLDIDLDIDIYMIPKADINDLDISQDVKMVLISYINELSKSNEDYTLYLSNIQTEVENKFVNYIRSTEIVINKEPDYRIIKYTKPVNNGNVDIIEARDIVADYVPECISLPIGNITVRIIR